MKDKEILKWADERGLLNPEFAPKQFTKLLEEVTELSVAMVDNNKEDIIDALGDCTIVLTILANQLGYDLDRCVYEAFNTIKNRKGVLKDGSFIKEEDLDPKEDYTNCKTIK